MSRDNVELHRQHLEESNERDIAALIAHSDPRVEIYSTFAAVGGAVYHGHDGMRSWLADLEQAWGAELRVKPEAYFDFGEQTLAYHLLHGRGRQSGVEVAMPVAHIARWRAGLGIYYRSFADREDALSDSGVTEDQLEPIDP